MLGKYFNIDRTGAISNLCFKNESFLYILYFFAIIAVASNPIIVFDGTVTLYACGKLFFLSNTGNIATKYKEQGP